MFSPQLPSFWGLMEPSLVRSRTALNPDQDAHELLNEYYDNFFGPASVDPRLLRNCRAPSK